MSETFTITKQVKYADLWEAIWGSDGSGIAYWCDKVRQADGKGISFFVDDPVSLYKPNPQAFKLHDAHEDKWHTVSLADLAEGYRLAVEQGLKHCGHYDIGDLDEADECIGDVVIQLAIFKDIIYG